MSSSCLYCWTTSILDFGAHTQQRVLPQDIVRSLGMLSTESMCSVSPALAQLQMLQSLDDAWPLRWPDEAADAVGAGGVDPAPGSALRKPIVPADAALGRLQAACRRREAVTGLHCLLLS